MRGITTIARSGDGGVKDLISRDRRQVELTDAFGAEAPAAPAAPAAAEPEPSTSAPAAAAAGGARAPTQQAAGGRRAAGPKSRKQRQADMAQVADMAQAADGAPAGGGGEPRYRRCKEAIDAGLEAFGRRDYQEAISLFNLALELPGNGAYRLSGSPREYACPSDAEEHAALYNMACAYAQLGQRDSALTCLEAILETGFKDVKTITGDPDLRPVQGPELNALISKHTGIGGVLTRLLRKDKQEVLVSDQDKNKPMILW